jgi:hypothetical protein
MTPIGEGGKAKKFKIALSAMMSMVDEWKASVIRLVGSRVSGGSSSGVDLAVAGNEDGLADSDLGRVDVKVDALDIADRGLVLGSQVEEEVATLDGVGLDEALGAGADGDVDELVGEDEVDVLDLLVGGDEAGEGDLVVGGDVGEGVAAADDVGRAGSDSAGGVDSGSRRRKAGGVVGSGAAGGNAELLAGSDQVGVGDVVEAGDVADARVVESGEAAEGLTGHDGVSDGGVCTAGESGG